MLKQVFIVVRHMGFHNSGTYDVNTDYGELKIPHCNVVGIGESLEEAEKVLDAELALNETPIIKERPNGAKYHTGTADEYMIIPTYIKSEIDIHEFCSNLMN